MMSIYCIPIFSLLPIVAVAMKVLKQIDQDIYLNSRSRIITMTMFLLFFSVFHISWYLILYLYETYQDGDIKPRSGILFLGESILIAIVIYFKARNENASNNEVVDS